MRTLAVLALSLAICSTIAAYVLLNNESVCDRPECHERAQQLSLAMDETVEPCDNFYRYVCGNFLNATAIPDNETSVNGFTVLRNKVSEQIRALLEDDVDDGELRYSKLAKTSYKVCMNETATEADGLRTMKDYLKRYNGWPVLEGAGWNASDFNWTETLFKFRDDGFSVSYLFDITVMSDLINSSRLVIYIDQPSFGLNKKFLDRDLTDGYVAAYYDLMVAVAAAFGADVETAKADFTDVLHFERNLSAIATNIDYQISVYDYYENSTIGELNDKFPFLHWNVFFDYVIKPTEPFGASERIIIDDPKYFEELANVLNVTDKRTIANYLMWRVIKDSVKYMNKDVLLKYETFEKISYGRHKMVSRWKECVNFVKTNFYLAVNAMYVKRHFNLEKREIVVEMVNHIRDSFEEILLKADWMDDETKAYAVKKLGAVTAHVACPNELTDDRKVEAYYENFDDVNATATYFRLQQSLNLHAYSKVYEKLRRPILKSNWTRHVFATEVNAFYTSTDNMIVVPAAILQDTFFDENLPNYVNYASIGLAIAHELTHGFDAKGRQFDKDGNAINWWRNETAELYTQKTECLERQYDGYLVTQVDMHVNGKHTLDENIADNGGIKEAYRAYKKWLSNNGKSDELSLPNLKYNNEQLFWISSAYIWCSKVRDQQLIRDITLNTHTPNEFRTIGMLSNMKEFADAFDCKRNTTMNPDRKCELW